MKKFSFENGAAVKDLESVGLPGSDWHWYGKEWEAVVGADTDLKGWKYSKTYKFKDLSNRNGWGRHYRKRCLIRRCYKVE